MARAEQDTITEYVLTMTEQEAALLRAILEAVVLSDKGFPDTEAGEQEYDDLGSALADIASSLADAGVPPTYVGEITVEILD